MRIQLLAGLLAATMLLSGCMRSLDEEDVRAFVDKADDAARKRFGPEICKLRGEKFELRARYQAFDEQIPPTYAEMNRALFCREAGSFSKLRQYVLERKSLEVEIAPDRKTAKVVAEYVETRPHYEYMPTTLDDFGVFVVVESRDVSWVGIEGGDIVFLSADVEAQEVDLIPKSELDIPYD